jgi:NTP pyrophosphatase (non-canonical NTP hydrolase)
VSEQQDVYNAVSERGYRDAWTGGQFAARQVAKLIEEVGELAKWFDIDGTWRNMLRITAASAKRQFDSAWAWDNAGIGQIENAKQELADVQVVVFCLAEVLGEVSGEPFNVAAAALGKSRGDIDRGVR